MNTTQIVTGGILDSQSHFRLDIDALKAGLNAYGKAFSSSNIDPNMDYIIEGCELSQSGSNVVMLAGSVYLSNEIFEVETETILNTTVSAVESGYAFYLVTSNVVRPTFKEGSKVTAVYRKASLFLTTEVGFTRLQNTSVFGELLSLNERISIPDATTIQLGKVQLATLNEVLAGTDSNKVITPSTLNSKVPYGTVKVDFSGTWNMDTTASFIVLAGVNLSKILNVSVWIKQTGGSLLYPLERGGYIKEIDEFGLGRIWLERNTAGFFDSPSFNNATGWVVIEYITN